MLSGEVMSGEVMSSEEIGEVMLKLVKLCLMM